MKYNCYKTSRTLLHLALAISLYLNYSLSSVAQTFPCDGKLYYVVEDNGIMKLVSVSNYTGSNTPVSKFECTLSASIAVSSNSLGANPVDGYLYFLEKKLNGKTQVRKLDANCNTSSICPVDMIPFTNAGCFDHLGIYWVIDGDQLIGWDLNTCTKVKGPYNLPTGKSANDLIYNTQDCFFYSGNVKVDASGNSTLLAGPGANGPGLAMGIDGKVYSIGGGNASAANLTRYDLPSTNGTVVGTVSPGTTGGTDAASFPCSSVIADFTMTVSPGCTLPRSVSFTDNSTGLITSWLWDFGDGSPASTLQNPSHTYSTTGPFSVKLTVGVTTSCLTISSGSKTSTLTLPSALTFSSASNTDVTCFGGTNGTATVTVSGGTTPYTYTWSPSAGTGSTVSNLSANTYTVTATDNVGCTKVTTVVIAQPTPLVLTPSSTNVSCFGGTNGTASVSASGGIAPYTYSWSPVTSTLSGISNLTSGNYTVIVSDTNGCTNSATPVITQPAIIGLTTSKTDLSCFGDNTGTVSVTATGGTSPYTYAWSPNNGNSSGMTNLPPNSYTVTVTDNNGCTQTDIAIITEPPVITLVNPLTTANVSCFGENNGSASVSVSGGTPPYTYAWSPTAGTGASVSNLTVGTYTVIITDNNGCTKFATTTITQPSDMFLTTSGSNVSCFGGNNGSASVSTSGGTGTYTYSWSPSAETGTTLSNLTAGTYTVTVTDNNGCTKTTTIVITVSALVNADFTPDPVTGTAPLTVNFTNNSTGGTTYMWYFGDGTTDTTFNTSHLYDKIGDYTAMLVVTGPGGCKDSITYTITVVEKTVVCVPNVFTPNNDGVNDVFYFCGQGLVVIKGTIYNRWGLVLYEWDQPLAGWDGRTNSGEEVPDGVYYYLIYARGTDNQDYVLKGFIQLLRSH